MGGWLLGGGYPIPSSGLETFLSVFPHHIWAISSAKEYIPYTANGIARHSAPRTHHRPRRSLVQPIGRRTETRFLSRQERSAVDRIVFQTRHDFTQQMIRNWKETPGKLALFLGMFASVAIAIWIHSYLLFRVRRTAGNLSSWQAAANGNHIRAYPYLQTRNVANSSRRTPLVGNRRCRFRCWDMGLLCIFGRQFFPGRSSHCCWTFRRMGS